jgi:hypothetical protein
MNKHPKTVTAQAGEVWITGQDSPSDVLLWDEEFTLSSPELELIEALTDAVLRSEP